MIPLTWDTYKVDWWLPETGARMGMGVYCLISTEFVLQEELWEKIVMAA